MRKPALLVVLALMLAGRPASAACRLGPCPPLVQALGYTFGAAIVGGYAYGTGYMIYRDFTDVDQSMSYGGTEMMINGVGVFLFGGVTVDAIANDHPGTAAARFDRS